MLTAPLDDLRASLSDEPVSAMQIAGQLTALRVAGVGYWEPQSEEEWTIALRTWKAALSAIPAPFVIEAFAWWAGTMNKRPSPSEIANRARSRIGEAKDRMRREAQQLPPPPLNIDPAEVGRRREMINRLSAEFPILRRLQTEGE